MLSLSVEPWFAKTLGCFVNLSGLRLKSVRFTGFNRLDRLLKGRNYGFKTRIKYFVSSNNLLKRFRFEWNVFAGVTMGDTVVEKMKRKKMK